MVSDHAFYGVFCESVVKWGFFDKVKKLVKKRAFYGIFGKSVVKWGFFDEKIDLGVLRDLDSRV